MRIVKTILQDAAAGAVQVKELTLGECRAWLADETRYLVASFDYHLLGVLSDYDLLPQDLVRFSDLAEDKIDAYFPSELSALVVAIKEVNRAFFVAEARRRAAAPTASPTSSAPLAPSPDVGTAPASGITPSAPS